jgi:SAM-dependent methyltransferase
VASKKKVLGGSVQFCNSPILFRIIIIMEKTIQFWNDLHAAAAGDQPATKQEWIYESSDPLFQMILAPLLVQAETTTMSDDDDNDDTTTNVVRILEIGCGTSTLAADLCDYWNRTYYYNNNSAPDPQEEDRPLGRRRRRRMTMIATDASAVCIEQQRANNHHPDQCYYEVWNILEPRDDNDEWKFDLIVDKGCVDTILFRAKKGVELVAMALSNIQHCLRTTDSPYCVISSRKKYRKYLAPVFAGRITSRRLDVTQKGDAVIVKKERNDQVFLYVCTTASPHHIHGTVESTISLPLSTGNRVSE